MSEIISIREYGRRKGWSDTYIRRLITNGVITEESITHHPTNHRPQIIFDKAEADLAMNYNAPRKAAKEAGEPSQPKPKIKPVVREVSETETEEVDTRRLPSGKRSKAEIDRLAAEVKLQTAAIELRKLKGELVEKTKVYSALYEIGQITKSNVLGTVDKVIDDVLAAPNRAEARALLYSRLNAALEAVSNVQDEGLNLNDRSR